jgi:hypothetical protein
MQRECRHTAADTQEQRYREWTRTNRIKSVCRIAVRWIESRRMIVDWSRTHRTLKSKKTEYGDQKSAALWRIRASFVSSTDTGRSRASLSLSIWSLQSSFQPATAQLVVPTPPPTISAYPSHLYSRSYFRPPLKQQHSLNFSSASTIFFFLFIKYGSLA